MEKVSLRVKNDKHSIDVLRWVKSKIKKINSAGVYIEIQTDQTGISPALHDGPSEIVGTSAIIAALSKIFSASPDQTENYSDSTNEELNPPAGVCSREKSRGRKNKSGGGVGGEDKNELEDFMMAECYIGPGKKEPNLEQEKDEGSINTARPPPSSVQSGGLSTKTESYDSSDDYRDLMLKSWSEHN